MQKAVETEAETDLIQRFLAGEREVFHDLMRPYERMYYRQAYSILRNQEDAEEAVQQAMIGIFTHLSQLTERDLEKAPPESIRVHRRGSCGR